MRPNSSCSCSRLGRGGVATNATCFPLDDCTATWRGRGAGGVSCSTSEGGSLVDFGEKPSNLLIIPPTRLRNDARDDDDGDEKRRARGEGVKLDSQLVFDRIRG